MAMLLRKLTNKLKQFICLSFLVVLFSPFAKAGQTDSTGDNLVQCTGKYALCASSECIITSSGAECNCSVYEGENWGLNSCQTRREVSATQVYSEYSPRNLLGSSGKSPASTKLFEPFTYCPESSTNGTGQKYVDCFDVLCTLKGKRSAVCPCLVVQNSKANVGFFVESSNCAKAETLCQQFTSTSSSGAVNSAPIGISIGIAEKSLSFYGQSLSSSMLCNPTNDKNGPSLGKEILTNKKTNGHDKLLRNQITGPCEDGCTSARDCKSNQSAPNPGFEWDCMVKPGVCKGSCYKKPVLQKAPTLPAPKKTR